MSDPIDSLPTDDYPMDAQEQYLFNSVIKPEPMHLFSFLTEVKDLIFFGILFFLFNTQSFDEFLEHSVAYARSSKLALLICKTSLYVIACFCVKYFHFMRK